MKLNENNVSVLKLKKLFVKDFSFQREERINKESIKPDILFSKTVEMKNDDAYIELSVSICDENSYTLNLTIIGVFNVGETELDKNSLLERNAIAIIFPYLRSQITLLTSQPSFNPIILPPININALFDEMEK